MQNLDANFLVAQVSKIKSLICSIVLNINDIIISKIIDTQNIKMLMFILYIIC